MSEQKITISLSSIFSILFVVLLIVLLWRLQDLLVLLMFSVVLAATIGPIVDRAEALQMPRWLAVLGVYLAVVGGFVGVGLLIGPTVITQTQSLVNQIPAYSEILYVRLQELATNLHSDQVQQLTQFINPQSLINWAVGTSEQVFLRSLGLTKGLVGATIGLILVLLISIYMVSSSDALIQGLVELFPYPWNRRLLAQVKPVSERMGNFILGRVIVSAILGVTITIGLTLLGLNQFSLALGVIAGFANLIPFVGGIIGLVPALIVGLSAGGWMWLWVLLLFVIVQNLEGNILTPLLIGSSVKLHPLYMLLAVLAGTEILGVLGALVVPPWVAGATVLLDNLYLRPKAIAEARENDDRIATTSSLPDSAVQAAEVN